MHLPDVIAMKRYFANGSTMDYHFRKKQLQTLRQAIQQYESRILSALQADLGKSAEEAYTTEIGFVYSEITHTLQHLKRWMRPKAIPSPLFLFPSKSRILRDPLGLALIIAPWNYPFQLVMAPLVGAIAGGNCAVIKPSEVSPHTAKVLNNMVSEYFNESYIAVAMGSGAEVVPTLMKRHRFDVVLYTGSTAVGRSIAAMAAETLTPVVLELGGKSPCIVDATADINVAARRIAWGKFTNAGQTCVAPDYVLVHQQVAAAFTGSLTQAIQQFYGQHPGQAPDYGRIVNQQHFERLQSYLAQGQVIVGGDVNPAERYISPTLIQVSNLQQPIMHEEIFGPILPLVTFQHHHQALEIIGRNPNPLALYLFTGSKAAEKVFIDTLPFGGGCINNTLVHLANPRLPFGGVGNSGLGAYHGRYSFDTFTRPKAVVSTGTWLDPAVKYPPYKGKMGILKKLFK